MVRLTFVFPSANVENIKKSISNCNWNQALENLSIDEKFALFAKIFERVICNSLFNYFISNKLYMPFQSDFSPGDSRIA